MAHAVRLAMPLLFVAIVLRAASVRGGGLPPQPRGTAAVFPLGGDAPPDLREQVWFALRAKLKRDATYTAIDGPTMTDAIAGAVVPTAATDAAAVRQLAAEFSPAVILWGEVDNDAAGPKLILNLLDLRSEPATPTRFERVLAQPTDLRFAVEDALKLLPGVQPFDRVSEEGYSADPALAARFARNPNLLPSGSFTSSQDWRLILGTVSKPPSEHPGLPPPDTGAIVPAPPSFGGPPGARVLAMRLSAPVAINSGFACLSPPALVTPAAPYRLQFRFWSDGPDQHVFIKGYAGDPATEREVYRRQVPSSTDTHGSWQTIICDCIPQSTDAPVHHVRIDLFASGNPGLVMFGDVQFKAVGETATTTPTH